MSGVWKRVLLEEGIRCAALEAVVGTPPIAIAQMLGADDRTLGAVGAVSLSVPLVVMVALVVYRLRRGGAPIGTRHPTSRRTALLLMAGAVLALGFALAERRSGLIGAAKFWSILAVNTLWVLLGLGYTLRRV